MEEMKLRKFLQNAKIPEDHSEVYLSLFIQNNLKESHMADVKEEQLKEMGIWKIAHINRILKEAEKQKLRERLHHLEEEFQRLGEAVQSLREEIQHVKEAIRPLKEEIQDLRRDVDLLLRNQDYVLAVIAG
ncbi:trichohyalin-like [Planococcus citri]|uniref:trichohyalin-like n=1 Tax=Planococcus citri TaxID=170843 RepID=UPI0031F74936